MTAYHEDEFYEEVAEDELCDCGKCHFRHCYQQGCFGMFSKKAWYDDDNFADEDSEYDDWDEEEYDDEDNAFWWDGSEQDLPETPAASNNGVPPSDLSDIPF